MIRHPYPCRIYLKVLAGEQQTAWILVDVPVFHPTPRVGYGWIEGIGDARS